MVPRHILVMLIVACAFAGRAHAQHVPLVLRLPASTRALALGDAFILGSTDANGIFYNPAFPEEFRGIAGGVQWYGSKSVLMSAAGAVEWWGGAVGIGVRALDYAAPASPSTRTPRASDLFQEGEVPVSERALSVAYTRQVKGIGLAATAMLVEERVAAERGSAVAFNVAAGKRFGPVQAGLAVHNLGPDLEIGGRNLSLADRVTLAASSAEPLLAGPLDLLPTAALSREADGRLVPAAGLEVAWWPVIGRTFYARAGVRRPEEGGRPFTLGAGFSGDRISLDYAYQGFEAGTAHRIGLRWQ